MKINYRTIGDTLHDFLSRVKQNFSTQSKFYSEFLQISNTFEVSVPEKHRKIVSSEFIESLAI